MGLLVEALRTVDFLSGCDPEVVSAFARTGHTERLAKGDAVCRAGSRAEAVVVPLSGELAELGCDASGRGICYAFLSTGECAGLLSAIDGVPEVRDVRVLRAGEFFRVEVSVFGRFVGAHPEIRPLLAAHLARRLREMLDERDLDVFLHKPARVARFLLGRTCVRQLDGARVLARETQPEIALRLGTVREVVAREMAALGTHGILRRTRHGLFVTDWRRLRASAECPDDDVPRGLVESPSSRTERFFLPCLAGGSKRVRAELAVCAEHNDDLSVCAAVGCPLARQASRSSAVLPADEEEPAPAPGRKRGRRARAERRRELRRTRSGRRRDAHEIQSRSPVEQMEILRRVDAYERRVEAIESTFGDDSHVPSGASVFDRNGRTRRDG